MLKCSTFSVQVKLPFRMLKKASKNSHCPKKSRLLPSIKDTKKSEKLKIKWKRPSSKLKKNTWSLTFPSWTTSLNLSVEPKLFKKPNYKTLINISTRKKSNKSKNIFNQEKFQDTGTRFYRTLPLLRSTLVQRMNLSLNPSKTWL